LGWILDLVKLLASSPFVFLHSFTVQEYRQAGAYFVELLALLVFPIAMVFIASLTYFAMFLFKDLFFYFSQLTFSTMADLGLIKILGSSALGKLFVWFLFGVLYVLAVFGQIIVGYKFMGEAYDNLLQKVKARVGASTVHPTQVVEKLVSKGGSPV
jgi:hypothetical protein